MMEEDLSNFKYKINYAKDDIVHNRKKVKDLSIEIAKLKKKQVNAN